MVPSIRVHKWKMCGMCSILRYVNKGSHAVYDDECVDLHNE